MDYKTLFSQTPPTRLFFKAAIPGLYWDAGLSPVPGG